MTHESGAPRQKQYELPANQIEFELKLIDEYQQEFPEQVATMHSGLSDIKRFSGINIPKYQIVDQDIYHAVEEGLVDELGYILSDGKPIFSLLMLQMPVLRSQAEISAMSEAERSDASFQDDGHAIIGEPSPSVSRLIDGLYSLTGANVVRDQRQEGQTRGKVVRKGSYHDSEIYFEEQYDDQNAHLGNRKTFKLWLVNEESGKRAIDELNDAEFDDFVEKSGLDRFQARDMTFQNDINRSNYGNVADTLRQTKEIIDGTEVSDKVSEKLVESDLSSKSGGTESTTVDTAVKTSIDNSNPAWKVFDANKYPNKNPRLDKIKKSANKIGQRLLKPRKK